MAREEKPMVQSGRGGGNGTSARLFLDFHPTTTACIIRSLGLPSSLIVTVSTKVCIHIGDRPSVAISTALYRRGRPATKIDHPEV